MSSLIDTLLSSTQLWPISLAVMANSEAGSSSSKTAEIQRKPTVPDGSQVSTCVVSPRRTSTALAPAS